MADRSERIRVTGAKELRKAIKQAEDQDLNNELKKAYRDAANIVTARAKANAPEVSGDLKDSVRSLGGARSAVVAIGKGKTSEYAGVVIFPNNRGITPNDFPYRAIRSEWDRVYDTFEEAIDRVTKKLSTD